MLPKILLAFIPLACWSQTVEIGVQGGVPLTQSFETGSFFTIDFGEGAMSATRRYTVGPMVRMSLPRGFGVELESLYQRLGFDDVVKLAGIELVHTRAIANSWEFPLLGTYQFLRRLPVKPYVAAGPAFRTTAAASLYNNATIGTQPFPIAQPTSSSILDHRSGHGVAVGGGVNLKAGFLRISPELRYARWAADAQADPYLHSNQNQVELLVGLEVKVR